jgi:type IX secretion system PorP/SprF family membrane protein
MKKFIYTLIACVALINVSNAQDPNFSQFFASPMTLNPALTGKFDGVYRVAGNYRNQWPTINNAFITKTVSVDFGIMKNRLQDIDQLGVGVLAVTDRAGDGVLVTNYAGLSLAYHKGLDEDGFHQIGAGFQGTFVNKRLDVNQVKFADQLTPLGFTGVTSEIFDSKQISVGYFDLNAGVLYNGSTNGYNNFYFGASMYHINRPKETFQGGEYLLSPRTTIQAGGKIPINGYQHYLHLSANHSIQAKANNTAIGGAFSYNVNNDEDNPTNIYIGAWYRFRDAAIPYIGLEFNGLHIGASYDATTSGLKTASNTRGGVELSIIYIKRPTDPNAKKLNCPRF